MNGLVKKTKPVSEEPGFAAPPSTDNGARAHDVSAVTEQVSTLVEGITIQEILGDTACRSESENHYNEYV